MERASEREGERKKIKREGNLPVVEKCLFLSAADAYKMHPISSLLY
jgi:hypothetical protein